MDDWPSLNEELTRKTSDQLALWMKRYDDGLIDKKTAICVVRCLYDTTSGLISKDLWNLIAAVYNDLTSHAVN